MLSGKNKEFSRESKKSRVSEHREIIGKVLLSGRWRKGKVQGWEWEEKGYLQHRGTLDLHKGGHYIIHTYS